MKDKLKNAYLYVCPNIFELNDYFKNRLLSLYCENKCFECAVCKRLINQTHLDVLNIYPEKNVIKVDEVRKIPEFISQMPVESNLHTVVIHHADKLNASAQNALLKSLEEPPANTVFFLLAQHTGSLLPTVRSRCERINIAPEEYGKLILKITDKCRVSEQKARLLANLSGGYFAGALNLASDIEFFAMRDKIMEMLNKLINQKNYAMQGYIDYFEGLEQKEDLQKALGITAYFFNDLIFLGNACSPNTLRNIDFSEMLEKNKDVLSNAQLILISEEIQKTIVSLSQNANAKLKIYSLFIKILTAIHKGKER